MEHRQRARVQHAGGARLLRAAGRRDAAARPDPARRLHQHDAGAARPRRRHRPLRRRDAQPLLRLVRAPGRPGRRRARAGGRAQRLGGQARQADHHHRVRRRRRGRHARPALGAVDRGVPVRAARDDPPRLRPRRRRRRRARVELRRLRRRAGRLPRRRQQEGRLHPRPPAQERRPRRCGGAGGLWHPPTPMQPATPWQDRPRRLRDRLRRLADRRRLGRGRRGRRDGDAARRGRRRRDVLRHRRRLRRRPLGAARRAPAARARRRAITVATKMGRRAGPDRRELLARALPRVERPLAREPRRGDARPRPAALPADRPLLPPGGLRGPRRDGRARAGSPPTASASSASRRR